ncbi:head-tail adaptor protein [Lysobacter sp. Root96]|nr:head-tail adaptor protein [Lysobacter sp. Root96]
MAAGKLRHLVRIERQVTTRDSSGISTKTWVLVAPKVWASIEPLSAREFVQSAATQAQVSTRITIRYRPGIQPSMRVIHGTQVYNIAGVLADKESGIEYLTLPCSEGVNDGT